MVAPCCLPVNQGDCSFPPQSPSDKKGSINPELNICHQMSQGLIAQGKLEYRYVDCGRVLEKISHSD